MSTQHPEALRLRDLAHTICNNQSLPLDVRQLAFVLAAGFVEQHNHITELEAQLAQRFDAADMATAAAQGFRDGVAKDQQARWRPIETAPKDGTEILGYTEEVGALVLYWDSMTGEMDHWSDGMSVSFWKPTHWVPLPAAPGPADGESNE